MKGCEMTGQDDLLVRLARAVATTPLGYALSERLCLACRDLAGADSAAITVAYAGSDRITLFATDDLAARLEDLQDVMGEGPGQSAETSGEVEVCRLRASGCDHWPQFSRTAHEHVGDVTIHAVPMHANGTALGVMTLYQVDHGDAVPLALDDDTLVRLAAATASALMRDPDATTDELEQGPWQSRARIHQATGMVVAQLGLPPDDALAVLRAHAYAGNTSLEDVASRVLSRSVRFLPPDERGR